LESLSDPDGLASLLTSAREADVQVIALLGGLTEAGSAAAASHTSAVSSDHAVVRELFAFHGALLVHDDRELVQAALGTSMLGRRAGNRVGVITGSGGAGVVAADILAGRGLTLPALSPGLREKLDARLPEIASTRNPVDVTAQTIGDDTVLEGVCTTLRDSGEVDLILVIGREDQAAAAGAIAGAAIPTAVALLDRDASGVRARIEHGEVVLPDLAAACTALAAATAGHDAGEGTARRVSAATPSAGQPLTAADSLTLVEKAGVEVAPWRLVETGEEAADFGAAEGWPLVLKADLPAEVHKAAAGGIRLDVHRDSAGEHTREMLARGHRVIAARQLRTSLELFAGVRRDAQWGLVVSAGLGGSHIELLDLTVAMPAQLPVEWLALRLDKRIFDRVPNRYAGLAAQLAKIAYSLAELAESGGFALVECNPLAVVAGRVVALDARVVR
jgi:acyl-CoA synthetase (NDP forming)